MWFFFGAKTPEAQSLFQSGWFVEGLLSQILIVHIIRTRRVPFVESRASLPLTALTLGVMAGGLLLPFTWLGETLGLTRLPLGYFPWLAAILISYCALGQSVKSWYARKYGYY